MTAATIREGSVASAAGLSPAHVLPIEDRTLDLRRRLFDTRRDLTNANQQIAEMARTLNRERLASLRAVSKRRRKAQRIRDARRTVRDRDARTGSLAVVVQPGALAHFPQIDQPDYRSLR